MINNAGNLIGSAPYTKTLSALFASDSTDALAVDDTGLELLALISNLPNNIVSVFIQNQSAEALQLFMGETDTAFTNGVTIGENEGLTIEPAGNNVYLRSTATGTTIVAIMQYSTIATPPRLV